MASRPGGGENHGRSRDRVLLSSPHQKKFKKNKMFHRFFEEWYRAQLRTLGFAENLVDAHMRVFYPWLNVDG